MRNKKIHFWWPLLMLAFLALLSFAVMLLWNWLLPDIARLPEITFWQALGLLALSRILFGGLGGMSRIAMGGAMHGRDRDHINPFREKWGKMSDEEQREFLRKYHPFHSRFFDGFGGEPRPEPNKDKE
jgi:hypothetical protein